jgi:hypothetical protein
LWGGGGGWGGMAPPPPPPLVLRLSGTQGVKRRSVWNE